MYISSPASRCDEDDRVLVAAAMDQRARAKMPILERKRMMPGAMNHMWVMGLFGLLVVVVLVLAAAALIKYLLSGKGNAKGHD